MTAVIGPAKAGAASLDWNVTDGPWNLAANWLQNLMPTATDDVRFNRPTVTPYTVTITDDAAANEIRILDNATTFALNGHTLTGGDLRVGASASKSASLTLQNGTTNAANVTAGDLFTGTAALTVAATGTLNVSGNLTAGTLGTGILNLAGGTTSVSGTMQLTATGTLNVAGGALVTHSLDASVGTQTFSNGSITVDGGLFKSKATSNALYFSGPSKSANRPLFTLADGATLFDDVSSANRVIAVTIGGYDSRGAVAVDGVGSVLAMPTTKGTIKVGSYITASGSTSVRGDGTLTLTNGGQASSGGFVIVGEYGGLGRLSIDGPGSKLTCSDSDAAGTVVPLTVGLATLGSGTKIPGDGTLTLTRGGQVTTGNTAIGTLGGKGRATVDGSGSLLNVVRGSLWVGGSPIGNAGGSASPLSDGTLILTNGGVVNVPVTVNGATYIGVYGDVGRATVEGSGSTLNAGGAINVGGVRLSAMAAVPVNGDLTVSRGGAVTTGASSSYIGGDGGIGIVTVASTTADVSTWAGNGTLYVGYRTNSPADPGSGTLNVGPGGRVTLAGGLAVYAPPPVSPATSGGWINLTGGTLQVGAVAASTPTRMNWTAGTFKITGSAFSVGATSLLGPATSIGSGKTLDVTSTTTIETGATLTVAGGTFRTGKANVKGGLVLTAGTVELTDNGPASGLGLQGTGGIDLQGGTLALRYTADVGSPANSIRNLLAAEYATAFQTGQIRSSVATDRRGLGYVDDGVSQVTIRSVLYGDADLDGGVTISDFNALATNFGQTGNAIWAGGDFDYDGAVTITDFNAMAVNFGQNLPAADRASSLAALRAFAVDHDDLAAFESAIVPEPAGLSLLSAGVLVGLCRRRNAC